MNVLATLDAADGFKSDAGAMGQFGLGPAAADAVVDQLAWPLALHTGSKENGRMNVDHTGVISDN